MGSGDTQASAPDCTGTRGHGETGRRGACTVTPGSEDPLRDGVGGGQGRGRAPTGPMRFHSGQALPSGGKGCEEPAGGGTPPAGRGPAPSAWLIPGGGVLSFAGTPTLSQPCPQATLLTTLPHPHLPSALEETGALGASPGQGVNPNLPDPSPWRHPPGPGSGRGLGSPSAPPLLLLPLPSPVTEQQWGAPWVPGPGASLQA